MLTNGAAGHRPSLNKNLYKEFVTSADIELLVRRAKDGDDKAYDRLWAATRAEIFFGLKGLYVAGYERSDIRSICRLALWQAIKSYESSRSISLGVYARLIARRQVLTALIASKYHKRLPLEDALQCARDAARALDDDCPLDLVPDYYATDAFDALLSRDELDERLHLLRQTLTEMERRVLDAVVDDPFGGYKDLSRTTGLPTKTIDNTLSRIRRKAGQPSTDAEPLWDDRE